jgi:hypothetical protein
MANIFERLVVCGGVDDVVVGVVVELEIGTNNSDDKSRHKCQTPQIYYPDAKCLGSDPRRNGLDIDRTTMEYK